MNHFLIEFNNIKWEKPQKGIKQKSFTKANKRIRLVRFTADFEEAHWCTKGHVGFVTQGNLRVEFEDKTIIFSKGNALWISEGEDFKHKVKMQTPNTAEVILFEEITLS